MRRTTVGVIGILALLLVPSVSSAQGYFIPFVGGNFGGDTGTSLDESISSTSRLAFGFRLGATAHGIFGAETDIGFTNDFYGTGSIFNSSNVLTFVGNLVVGIPAGPVHLYLTGGLGGIRRNIDFTSASSLTSFSETSFAYDIGGGVSILFSKHVGINGDFRYFRNFGVGNAILDTSNDKFNFGRGSIGLVLQF